MTEKTLKLDLTVAEVNAVLSLVAKGPFEAVYQLVQKIKTQAESQLAEDQVPSQQQLNG
jgi:hypothetical protein